MKEHENYIEIPELEERPEALYTEDDCIKITNNYFKYIKSRMQDILTTDGRYSEEETETILQILGFSMNHIKSEKSIDDCFRNKL